MPPSSMPSINWPLFFEKCPFPHDPQDHLVASDYFEDLGLLHESAQQKELAAFWEYVKVNDLSPIKDNYSKDTWWWCIPGYRRRAELFVNCPEELAGFLPADDYDDVPGGCYCIFLWVGHDRAWEALYHAWCRAFKVNKIEGAFSCQDLSSTKDPVG